VSHFTENAGGLNGSMQHWLGVYSPESQNPKSFAGVDLSAALLIMMLVASIPISPI
jgi:hypothetical protein